MRWVCFPLLKCTFSAATHSTFEIPHFEKINRLCTMLLVAMVEFFTLCPLRRASGSPLSVYFSVCLYVSLFVLLLPENSSRQRNKESVLCILSVCSTPAAASPSVASNTHPHTPTHTLPLLASFDFPLTPTRPFLLHCSSRYHGNWSSC